MSIITNNGRTMSVVVKGESMPLTLPKGAETEVTAEQLKDIKAHPYMAKMIENKVLVVSDSKTPAKDDDKTPAKK